MRDSNELIHRCFAKTETPSGIGMASLELPAKLDANSKPFTPAGPDGPPLQRHSGSVIQMVQPIWTSNMDHVGTMSNIWTSNIKFFSSELSDFGQAGLNFEIAFVFPSDQNYTRCIMTICIQRYQ
jgi:hypothetical protein